MTGNIKTAFFRFPKDRYFIYLDVRFVRTYSVDKRCPETEAAEHSIVMKPKQEPRSASNRFKHVAVTNKCITSVFNRLTKETVFIAPIGYYENTSITFYVYAQRNHY